MSKGNARGIAELAWTILIGALAVLFAWLGCVMAFSNMETSSYSTSSIGWAAGYLAFAVALPLFVARRLYRSKKGTTEHTVRVACLISLVVGLVFLPFALLLFAA